MAIWIAIWSEEYEITIIIMTIVLIVYKGILLL